MRVSPCVTENPRSEETSWYFVVLPESKIELKARNMHSLPIGLGGVYSDGPRYGTFQHSLHFDHHQIATEAHYAMDTKHLSKPVTRRDQILSWPPATTYQLASRKVNA